MKILIIADWHGAEVYAGAFYNRFKDLGYDTYKFSWKEYFQHYQYADRYKTDGNKLKSFLYRFQNKFLVGPVIWNINKDIVKQCKDIKPDLVFIYRGTHIYPKTIIRMKVLGAKVFGYNNDDPFSSMYSNYVWRLYRRSIKHYDWIFSYRFKNIDDYKRINYDKVSLLRSYYIKTRNFYIKDINKEYDVVFIGHFENDGRDEIIKFLIENNINVKLFGTLWENSKLYNYFIDRIGEIKPLYGDNYNITLNKSKIALVFLSKLNNDTYTRRCFEIPATKTMMMAEYTKDLDSMFHQSRDAEYFLDKVELLEKIIFFLKNENKLNKISNSGYDALINNGHEVKDRCKEIIKVYNG